MHVQVVAVEHVVGRATPLRRISEPVPALPGTKFNPCTDMGKPSIAPAIALAGRMASMVGPDVMAIVADADFVLSASLVAMIEIAFGDGATVGAVKTPLASTEPQAAPPQPWPATADWTLHVTEVLLLSVTATKNWRVLRVLVERGTKA